MRSNHFKKLVDETGKEYLFNNNAFKFYLKSFVSQSKKEGNSITINNVIEEISLKENLSVEAIKNWMYGYNGPSDMEAVKTIATVVPIDYKDLLLEVEKEKETLEMDNTKALLENVIDSLLNTERTREIQMVSANENTDKTHLQAAIREIYHKFIQLMNDFEETSGFCDFYSENEYYAMMEKVKQFKQLVRFHMLEMPKELYDGLLKFYECELMTYFYMFEEDNIDIFDLIVYEEFLNKNNLEDNEKGRYEYVQNYIDEAYKKIEELLRGYVGE